MKLIDRVSMLLLGAGVVLPLAEIVHKHPDNHGGSPWGYGSLTVAGLVATLVVCVLKRRLVWRRCMFAAAFVLLVWCCDVFNILIPYEIWIERGMPTWGTPRWTCSRHVRADADLPRLKIKSPCGRFMLVAYRDSQTGVDDVIVGGLRDGRVLAEEHGAGLLEKLEVGWRSDSVALWPGKVVPLEKAPVR